MTLLLRAVVTTALSAALSGCMGSLLGGGKAPSTLYTLTTQAADPGTMTRTVNAGQAVTIGTPLLSKELRTVRAPVQVTPTDVQYVPDLQWVDTPDRLFEIAFVDRARFA